VLTFGCRRYFLFVLVPGFPSPLPFVSFAESSLRYEPSAMAPLAGAIAKGRSEDWPLDSAMARWSFCGNC
jgi:hypothetical protein